MAKMVDVSILDMFCYLFVIFTERIRSWMPWKTFRINCDYCDYCVNGIVNY